MTVNLSSLAGAGQQFFSNSGVPLTGGKLYSYAAGTTTPQTCYTTAAGNVAHPNPIILDSSGRVSGGEIWLTAGSNYKFALYDSTDVLISTWDNITGINGTGITANASNVQYDPYGTSAVSTTVQNKLRQTVSVFDFMTSAQIADVQAGAASIDCLASFQAAIDSFSTALDTTFYSMGGTIYVPPGKYYLSDTLKIARNINLIGAGAPYGNDESPSQLLFAQNKTGILCVDYRNSPNNKQGSGLIIQNLYLRPKTAGGTVGHGISLKTTARIINVMANGWPQNGINIVADTAVVPPSNANVWYLSGCTTSSNAGHGLYVQGGDANAGACYSHNASGNGGIGIYDSSFLGNTYVGCHSADNTLGAYKSDNANARNMFLGCYEEGGQPLSTVLAPSIVIGGLNSISGPKLTSDLSVPLISKTSFGAPAFVFGYGRASPSAGTITQFADTSGTFSWDFVAAVGRLGYKWANLGSGPGYFQFYDRNATVANGYARNIGDSTGPSGNAGAIGISDYFFGPINQMKYRGLGTGAPISGEYLQGDIIWNSAPTSGGYIGWVCTASGNPGTWKTFGLIS